MSHRLVKIKNYYQPKKNNYIDLNQVVMIETTSLVYGDTNITIYRLWLTNDNWMAVDEKELKRLFPNL